MCVLFETRLAGRSIVRARRALPRSWGFYVVDSQGLSGGIIVTWKLDCGKLDIFNVSSQEVIMVISEGEGRPWIFAAVYASTDFRARRTLWEEASKLVDQGQPMLIAGDFNWPRFTWCNNQQGPARVWERLDRAFATAGWIQEFPDNHVKHLPRIASDHSPILVCTDRPIPFRCPFRFERLWLCYPRSWGVVSEAWNKPVRGDAMYRVSRRLELTRRYLRRWNRVEVGNIFRRIEELEEAIANMQLREASGGGLSHVELSELRSFLSMHDALLSQQEIFWRQKSRVQWIQEGDRNTKFFHQSTLIRRQRNRIRSIRDEDGQAIEDPIMICRVFEQFFRTRWTERTGSGIFTELPLSPEGVSDEDSLALIRPVSGREIQEAVWSLEGDKAPGPDGFPPVFFRRYWSIVGLDVIEAIQQFFSTAEMSPEWQRTFITLIPKRQVATEPGHFRPISLCSTLYKITAKILAIRMRGILPRIISPEQGAFIGGRNISDNVLIAQEFMFDLVKAPVRCCLMGVKLDMERAYDRMCWDFLRHSLQSFGFHEMWIRWIMGCVRGPSFSILVNGSPSHFFDASVGLRQGCPLSPLLFIICADALSRALRVAVDTQTLEAYRPVQGAVPISHLLFADDCLLLARATRQNAHVIRRTLYAYCSASGQRVNLNKSSIFFSPKTKVQIKAGIMETLGVGEQEGTLTYLGVPILGRRMRSGDTSSLEHSIRHRLEGWQMHSLSMMGRVTLARSVLSAIPVYLVSHTVPPVASLRSVERLIRDFIWGRRGDRGRVHLVAWEVVCQPVRHGGLGVPSLVARREASILRLAASLLLEPESLWSSLMRAKYGALTVGIRAGRLHSPIWREISVRAPLVLPAIRWAVGDGMSVDVLEDSWVTELPISRLPVMVDTSRLLGRRVGDLLVPEEGSWDEVFIRETFGEQLVKRILALPIPSRAEPDRLVWLPTGRSRVRARDIHAWTRREPERRIDGGWIWRMRVHPRVALFIWKVAWGCLPTRSVLARRGMRMGSLCEVCLDAEETVGHVLLRCPVAMQCWRLASALLPPLWESVEDMLRFLSESIRRPREAETGSIVAYLAYHIWLARNDRLFEGGRLTPRAVMERALRQAAETSTLTTSAPPGRTRDIWGTCTAVSASRFSYFSWVPPPPGYLKVNFDGGSAEDGTSGGVGFVIRDHRGTFIAAGGRSTFGVSAVGAELQAAWEGVWFARRVLGAERLVLEGDCSVVIDWIRGVDIYGDGHPLIRDTRSLVRELISCQVVHAYREANSAADWVASYVARHTGEVFWSRLDGVPHALFCLLFFDMSGCIHVSGI
ncbi:uncharacterized protein LOC120104815 [Phoenix dactylifera]|uniref:Uncharacterized protein LOC120104815 n=1 Tax=Phoenix dactylifera TaxID=42345 RepID=A0A8B8ZGX4_PHODC|nr:uncharacterized protein LOC120104815 [Phoenix dactylifera]